MVTVAVLLIIAGCAAYQYFKGNIVRSVATVFVTLMTTVQTLQIQLKKMPMAMELAMPVMIVPMQTMIPFVMMWTTAPVFLILTKLIAIVTE